MVPRLEVSPTDGKRKWICQVQRGERIVFSSMKSKYNGKPNGNKEYASVHCMKIFKVSSIIILLGCKCIMLQRLFLQFWSCLQINVTFCYCLLHREIKFYMEPMWLLQPRFWWTKWMKITEADCVTRFLSIRIISIWLYFSLHKRQENERKL